MVAARSLPSGSHGHFAFVLRPRICANFITRGHVQTLVNGSPYARRSAAVFRPSFNPATWFTVIRREYYKRGRRAWTCGAPGIPIVITRGRRRTSRRDRLPMGSNHWTALCCATEARGTAFHPQFEASYHPPYGQTSTSRTRSTATTAAGHFRVTTSLTFHGLCRQRPGRFALDMTVHIISSVVFRPYGNARIVSWRVPRGAGTGARLTRTLILRGKFGL